MRKENILITLKYIAIYYMIKPQNNTLNAAYVCRDCLNEWLHKINILRSNKKGRKRITPAYQLSHKQYSKEKPHMSYNKLYH